MLLTTLPSRPGSRHQGSQISNSSQSILNFRCPRSSPPRYSKTVEVVRRGTCLARTATRPGTRLGVLLSTASGRRTCAPGRSGRASLLPKLATAAPGGATGSETRTTARTRETSSRPSVIIERACVGVLSPCPRRPCVSALACPRRGSAATRRARHSWRGAAAVRGGDALVAAGFVGGGRPSCCVAAVSWLLCAAAFYRCV